MIRWIIVFVLCTGAASATPLEQAWRSWATDVGATETTLVSVVDGMTRVASIGIEAQRPVPVASLSKAITASCLRHVLDADPTLSLDTPLGQILTVPGQNSSTSAIPLRSFLHHTSGLDEDSTQASIWMWLGGDLQTTRETVAIALTRPPGAQGRFFYNNENYEILAAVIERLTGQVYFDACQARMLAPLSRSTARAADHWAALAGAGGWAITAQDYAAFFVDHAAAQGDDMADVGGGAFYGDGVFVRPTARGRNIWHFGTVCLRGRRDSGAFAVVMDSGAAMVVTYNICPSREQALALQTGLIPILTAD